MNRLFLPSDLISTAKGVGPSTEEKLNRLGITTIGDLLRHFPGYYLDFTHETQVRNLVKDQPASFLATIGPVKTFYSRNQKLISQAHASDNTGKILLTWFNNPYIKRLVKPGEIYSVAGKPSLFGTQLTIISPVFEEGNSFSLNTKGLVPVYPLTAGLTSRWLRKKIFEVLNETDLNDPVSESLLQKNELLALPVALKQIHFPATTSDRWQADKRLSFNEHLRININNRLELLRLGKSLSLKISKEVDSLTSAKLPWQLTEGQLDVVSKIYLDLKKDEFTHRLIQGETGSGKTAPLVFAANQCLSGGFSCAILAPTEILATQHFETFKKFSLFPEQVVLITALFKPTISGKPTLYIGTHALFGSLQPELSPPLAFVAVDEQHKFGVAQRDLLLQRSPVPHLFNLSATPIPRTVALGLLGDINLSTIKHKPLNRLPTKTFIISPSKFSGSWDWLVKMLDLGNQIFVVCPNITNSSGLVSSVEDMTKKYRRMLPKQFPVWSIHGRLTSAEQRGVLNEFKSSRTGILVATSLIEVGIDIPEANIMIIHSAERFGLAQLHQLRGRVGRGEGQGYCFLVPSTEDGVEIERLQLLKKHLSGMILAQKDLRLRGAGEVFGFKQHGALPTRLKYFWSKKLFTLAKSDAKTLVENDAAKATLIATGLITW